MLGVSEITCYQTYDGEIFKTREEAEAHNAETFESAIPFDEFYMYDEKGNIITRADDSLPNGDDVWFFYAKTPLGAKFIEMYLADYCGSELKIEPKMLYRFDALKLAWVSQKECLDEFNSTWKGLITFEEAHC